MASKYISKIFESFLSTSPPLMDAAAFRTTCAAS